MLKPRKIHRNEQDKEKLYDALRELYEDGVRVYTGRLPANELIKRKLKEPSSKGAVPEADNLQLADDIVLADDSAKLGHNPYNNKP